MTNLTEDQWAMVEGVADIAKAVASSFRKKGYDFDEAEMHATTGLMDAARTWRPDGGSSFRTHAVSKARFAVVTAINNGRFDVVRMTRRDRANQDRSTTLARSKPHELVRTYGDLSRREDDFLDGDVILKAVRNLPGIRADVVELYAIRGLTMRKVGEAIGCSESRVCQAYAEGLSMLREISAIKELAPC